MSDDETPVITFETVAAKEQRRIDEEHTARRAKFIASLERVLEMARDGRIDAALVCFSLSDGASGRVLTEPTDAAHLMALLAEVGQASLLLNLRAMDILASRDPL